MFYQTYFMLEGVILPFIALVFTALAAIYLTYGNKELEKIIGDGTIPIEDEQKDKLSTISALMLTAIYTLWGCVALFAIVSLMHLFGENIIEDWAHLVPLVLVASLTIGIGIFIGAAWSNIINVINEIQSSNPNNDFTTNTVNSNNKASLEDVKNNIITGFWLTIGAIITSIIIVGIRVSKTKDLTDFQVVDDSEHRYNPDGTIENVEDL